MTKHHDGNKEPLWLHGGWRPDSGRKRSPVPVFNKKLRATPERQAEFLAMMTGDAARDFDMLFALLKLDQKKAGKS